ncbi:MAG TPA: branched-chain amino acid ABC transporter substrate-binding protein [Actinomycetota bacterium]|nr:branched-chain amino acid ABC transporter substrate-binding protein [Actinomycetota bacterium]
MTLKGRVLQSVTVLGVLLLVLAGCSRDTGGGDAQEEKKTVKIGVVAPLTGALSELGLGIKNSVDLAIRQANEKGTVPGYELVLAAEDDAADPATGANAANKLASDPQVAGVVGTLNSSVAQSVAPVLAKANISQVSPANTNPTLTRGPKPDDAPQRVWPTYTRVATTDTFQGPFAADYALGDGGFKSAFVIHDKKTYGQGQAETFTNRFEEKGGTIAGTETVNENDRDFGAVVTKVIGAKPDMVYYGGEYPAAGPLAAQLADRGFEGPLMGGDGIYASDFFKGAGDKGEGTLATSIGEPVANLESAKQFVTDYEAAGFNEGFSAYGAQSYDAANILIQGMAKALPNADSVEAARPQIVEAVNATSGFQGATGEHTFDEYGDTSNRALTVYKAEGQEWTPVFSGAFQT